MTLCNTNPIYNIIQNYLLEGHTEDSMLLILFYSVDFSSVDKKFAFLKRILDNPFLKNSQTIPYFWGLFEKIQKIHFAFSRVLYLWKYKRSKIYNTEDLFMNPIICGQRGTITILENETKYIFHIRELLNSIQTNLSNCSHFFPDIKPCKNPYTNLPFKKSNLYNIYFAIRSSAYSMPILFERFFLESFNLRRFSRANTFLINEEYLQQYSKTNINIHNVKDWVDEMFSLFKMQLKIHKNFPRHRLMEIMLPYIDLYNKSQYYMNTNKSERSYRTLYNKINRFINFNPRFGRQNIHIHKRYNVVIHKYKNEKIVSYNDKHPAFDENNNNNSTNSFMTNHSEYISNNISRRGSNIEIPIIIQDDSSTETDDDEEEAELAITIPAPSTPILYSSSSSETDESE